MFGFGKRKAKPTQQPDFESMRFVMAHMTLLVGELVKRDSINRQGMDWLKQVTETFYNNMRPEYGEEAAQWGRMALGLILVDVEFSRHVAANVHHIGPNLEIPPPLVRDIMTNLSQI